jgi:hypothetical protein
MRFATHEIVFSGFLWAWALAQLWLWQFRMTPPPGREHVLRDLVPENRWDSGEPLLQRFAPQSRQAQHRVRQRFGDNGLQNLIARLARSPNPVRAE